METGTSRIGRINLKLFSTFLIVGETLSFRAAAERMRCSQSAITAQIKQLEAQIGVALFRRTTRDVQLTPEGAKLLVRAQRALYELDSGLRQLHEAADLGRGAIALACSSTVAASFLPSILLRFNGEFPQVRVTLREVQSPEFLDCLKRGHADFCVGPAIDDLAVESEPLFDDPIIALVPRRFMAAKRTSIGLHDLAGLPLALFGAATAIRNRVEKVFRQRGFHFDVQFECRQAHTLVALAEGSLAVAVLPLSALKHHDPRNAAVLRISDPLMHRPIAIVRLRSQDLTPRAERLVQLLREELGAGYVSALVHDLTIPSARHRPK
jgi:DNA-binding transcriptional LysR family regulator